MHFTARLIPFTALLLILLAAGCSRKPAAATERQYLFSLKSAAGLRENAEITYLGAKVGYVRDVRLGADGESVVATGFINNPDMRLRQGDSARVVFAALLADP